MPAEHDLWWALDGRSGAYRWQCTCGFRPHRSWPWSAQTWRVHLEEVGARR